MVFFYNLCSSSKGNCTYIGTENEGILVDAGIGIRCFEKSLFSQNISPHTIKAVFITHEHSDHIKGLDVISHKYGIPVYSSGGTAKNISLLHNQHINVIDSVVSVSGFEITPFHTSHDTEESLGYTVSVDNKKIGICTDLGFVSDEILLNLSGCDFVMLESNYDENMLMSGDYPFFLKKRIASNRGHLSNEQCAKVVEKLIYNNVKRFALAHLSEQNNLPEVALTHLEDYRACKNIVIGRDCFVEVLKTVNDGKVIEI